MTTTTDDRAQVLLACLEPWLPALKALCPRDAPWNWMPRRRVDADGSLVVWFDGRELFRFKTTAASLDRVCEALSLLAAIAHGDVETWKTLLMEIWPANRERFRELFEDPLPEKFTLGFEVTQVRPNWMDHIYRFQDEITSTAPPSLEYANAREFLETELSIQRGGDDEIGSRIRLRLEKCDFAEAHETTTEFLQRALELVKAQASFQATQDGGVREFEEKRPRFTITNVEFVRAAGLQIDYQGLRCLHELTQHGIPQLHLPALTLEPTSEDLPEFVGLLRDFVGLDAGEDGNATLEKHSVAVVAINDSCSSLPVMEAVLAAVQHSSSVRTLEIDVGRDYEGDEYDAEYGDEDQSQGGRHAGEASAEDGEGEVQAEGDAADEDNNEDGHDNSIDQQTELWQWIAFSVFSRHAAHKIDTLVLNAPELQASDVDAIRRVLEASNPHSVARGRTDVLPPRSDPRQITASRFVLEYPTSTAPTVLFESKRSIAVRVLGTPTQGNSPWYEVFLPGHGDAWVHEHDVLSQSEDDIHLLSDRQVQAFRQIEIGSMMDGSMDSVADLLALIGHETRRISYYKYWDVELSGAEPMGERSFDHWCEQLLAACPQLEAIKLDGARVDNLNIFETSARARHCRLRQLQVSCAPTGDSAQNARAFFDALSDSSHPLTEHLRELELGLIIESQNAQHVIEPVMRMLNANRRLVKIQITLLLRGQVERLRSEFSSAFAGVEASREGVFVRAAPLELRCKLALLSVVAERSRLGIDSFSHLDRTVLSLVFQFAAHGCVRDCEVYCEEFPPRYLN